MPNRNLKTLFTEYSLTWHRKKDKINLYQSNRKEVLKMKKFVSAIFAAVMAFAFSVTSFAGAPSLFEGASSVINTGGEGRGFVIAACVAGGLAVVGMVAFFLTGKKK